MKIEFSTYEGGTFILNPETLGDKAALRQLVLAGLAVPVEYLFDWVDGGCIIQASPLGANFGALLYGLVAHGDAAPFLIEYEKCKAEYDEVTK